MKSELTSGETLYCFQNKSLIIYFERNYDTALNDFIRSNHKQLLEISESENIDFCYLPFLLQNDQFQSVVGYNQPYLKTEVKEIEIQRIYDVLISKQFGSMPENGLLLWSNQGELTDVVSLLTGNETQIFESFRNTVLHFADSIQNNSPNGALHFNRNVNTNHELTKEPTNEYRRQSIGEKEISKADDQFETEAFRLADEIRERIQKLKECDSLSLIADIIDEINNNTQKLSSLCITSDYRIILKDYSGREVEMTPLSKSVFILFLRYPQGILFKELIDYHDELLSIYLNITKYDDIDRAKESIRALTDPLNGSINEKCSRIRAAFLEVIADKLAHNYYITGMRGEPKKIKLDRKLVEFT